MKEFYCSTCGLRQLVSALLCKQSSNPVAQLKTIFVRRSFFLFSTLWREMFVPHILRCWVSATMQASAPTQHRMGQVPLSPLHSTLSIVVPPDSHFCLVEPIRKSFIARPTVCANWYRLYFAGKVRIQVAQLKTIFARRSFFFCFIRCGERCSCRTYCGAG